MRNATTVQHPIENRLLRLFSTDERTRLGPRMQLTPLALGLVLYELGGRLDHAYFPTTAVVSSLYTTREGSTAEIALLANDGLLSIAQFLGSESNPHRAVVQIGGYALRISTRVLQAEFARGGTASKCLASLYAGTHYTDLTTGCLQPAAFRRTALMSMAALVS